MSSQRPRREDPEAGTRAAKKQAMQARLKNMEVERLKMNTFLKESGYVRHPVAEDGDCCYLAILGSLGVLPPGEVANPGSSSLRAVKVLREMAYASVTGTSILDEADLEAFHESIPSHFVRKNSRNKNDVKNMDKRGDIFTKLLEYHIPLGRWSDSLSLQPFMVAGAGWWLQCDIYSISMAHGVADMVTTNSRVTFNDEKQSFEPMPNPGPNNEDGPRFQLPYFSKDGATVPYQEFVDHLRGLVASGHPLALIEFDNENHYHMWSRTPITWVRDLGGSSSVPSVVQNEVAFLNEPCR